MTTTSSPSIGHRARGWLLGAAETLVLTLVLFVVIQAVVAQPYEVRQDSMERTLLPNQYVLVDKLTPRFEPYRRGDIVVFTPPGGEPGGLPYIKRIIGLPGDTVDLREGHVFVDGKELIEPYVYGGPTEPRTEQSHWVVPAGTLFVLGDHRDVSSDSRVFGPVPTTNAIGRAWLRYWPLDALEVLATPRYPPLTVVPAASPAGFAPRGGRAEAA